VARIHAAQSSEGEPRPAAVAAGEADLRALTEAFERFSRTSATMEESYRRLEARIQSLDRELEARDRELQEKNRQLEELRRKDRLAALGEMAATVAHEIRNPLGGIQGFAALLERDIPQGDPRRRLVEKILAGTKSLDRVVGELLEYTRPIELKLETIDARALVDSALSFLSSASGEVSVRNDVPDGLALRGDAHKLRQVLLNVLQNAVQSIDGAGRVEVTAQAARGRVVIAIKDTGCGISAEHLAKVFMPFFTTREKGTGLGLAVAAKIVESHGGTMDVRSTAGAGSEFSVALPVGERG
jgi:signal transduction histidine kinase